MTKEESLNRWWTEYMGECWHDPIWSSLEGEFICRHCADPTGTTDTEPNRWFESQKISSYVPTNYISPSMFLTCFKKAREDEDWDRFWKYQGVDNNHPFHKEQILSLINSPIFQEAWAKFKGWKF